MQNWKKVVAADLFDDEYIIANLSTGLYYSVQGSIINILKCLPFKSIDEIIEENKTLINSENKGEIIKVWKELVAEELIDSSYSGATMTSKIDEFIETPKKCKLSKYADMQDLLALDPIHEVDEKGWPKIDESKE